MKRMAMVLMAAVVAGAFSGISLYASGTSSTQMQDNNSGTSAPTVSLYEQGLEAVKNNQLNQAIGLFEKALADEPRNADILNQLAHAQRKAGLLDEALENYRRALKLRPNFPEAREYLGEAYLQAALRELKTLKGYGAPAQEEVEDLTKDIKEAAQELK